MNALPVNTAAVAAVLLTEVAGENRMLLLKRTAEDYWCHLAGKIEAGESAIEAIRREIREETGLVVETLYSADYLIRYWDQPSDSLFLVPVFVARVPADSAITLNDEHSDYRWCTLAEALELAPFPNQHATYAHVWRYFCDATPSPLLRVRD